MATIRPDVEARRTRLRTSVRQVALNRWKSDPDKAARMADLGVRLLEHCFQKSDQDKPAQTLSKAAIRHLKYLATHGLGYTAREAKERLREHGVEL